ncbi:MULTISPECIES: PIN domain-containing protein [Anaerotignum]|uniref:PIN domain-containing protein n=1 Tax=Anaerotignum TaxID=2039240 RepID=UPI00210DC92B|nr:PIN domain-containing protein [Anaerotignum sp.]MCQ4937121.1 PIN domain-containing protein [Anaerotignum propionicum]
MILLKNKEVILLQGIIYEKTYVLDTSVLILSPVSLLCFEENNLVLPIVCLEKLDN